MAQKLKWEEDTYPNYLARCKKANVAPLSPHKWQEIVVNGSMDLNNISLFSANEASTPGRVVRKLERRSRGMRPKQRTPSDPRKHRS